MNPEILQTITVFATVAPDHRDEIASYARELSVPAGAAIMTQGDYSYDFVAIVEGEADVLRDGQLVGTLGPGESFGEIGVLERRQRTATVQATTPMRLVLLTRWDVKRLSQDVLLAIRDQHGAREVAGVA